MEFGIVEVEVEEETDGLGARPAARHGLRQRRDAAAPLSGRRRRHALEAALPVRARRRRLPRRRRAHRGLRADPGRPPGGPPRSHLQGAARRGRGAGPPADARRARGARGAPRPSYDAASERGLLKEFRSRLGDEIAIELRYVDSIPREPNGKFRAVKSAVGTAAMIRVGLARTTPSYAGLDRPVRPRQGVPRARAAARPARRRPGRATTSTRRSARRCYALGLDAERYGSAEWNPLGALAPRGARIVLKPNFIRHWNPLRGATVESRDHARLDRARDRRLRVPRRGQRGVGRDRRGAAARLRLGARSARSRGSASSSTSTIASSGSSSRRSTCAARRSPIATA